MHLRQDFHRWWYQEPTVPQGWRLYLMCHLLIVVAFAAGSLLDSGRYGHGFGRLSNALLEIFSIYVPVAPLVTLRIIYLARDGGPSYTAFAAVDVLLCIVHVMALLPAIM